MRPTLKYEDYTIGWICALPVETTAALFMLDKKHNGVFPGVRGDDNNYIPGTVSGHNVVIASLPDKEIGPVSAASLVSQMRQSFPNLRYGLMVGIGAGVPGQDQKPDIRLGDVVVATPGDDGQGIVDYELGKETMEGFVKKGWLNPMDRGLRNAFRTIQAEADFSGRNAFAQYLQVFQEDNVCDGRFKHPGQGKDLLYHAINTTEVVERPETRSKGRSGPVVHYGLIASGNKVVKNAKLRDELRDKYKIVCFEMEAAGLMNIMPVAVIRGISDYADSHKNDEWQPYAAAVAAAYAKGLLDVIGVYGPSESRKLFAVVPFARNDDFVIRDDTFKALDMLLTPHTSYHTIAIWGLGGCGKTQIALEYAYRRQEETSCSIFWVRADNEARFTQNYTDIAKIAGLSLDLKGEELLRAVQQWIEQQTSWLLILDNVDDLSIFKKPSSGRRDYKDQPQSPELLRFVPKGSSGSVIWTSRDGSILGRLVGVSQGIEVGAMTNQESLKLFQKLSRRSGTEEPSESEEKLLELLQRLPLAIAQAAAYVRKTKVSILQYLRMFKESEDRQSDLLSEEFEDAYRSDVPNSVMHTWLISMKEIAQENQCGERILNIIAFLDNKGLPFELLRAIAGPKFSEDEVLLAAARLMEFSFLQVQVQRTPDEGLPTYEQHRLIRLATRRALNTAQARLYSREAIKIMRQLFPNGSHETWGSCKLYLPHALKAIACVEAEGYKDQAPLLLSRVSMYYWQQGRLGEAEKLDMQALELQKSVLGEKHPETIMSMANLAVVWRQQGRLDEAEQLDVQVLELRKSVLGEKHPETITSMANLAVGWLQQGRLGEAEKLQVQVLELHKSVLGKKHPETITSMANLASVWWQQGRSDEAEELSVQVLELRKSVLGEKHPDTITSMANLDVIQQRQLQDSHAEQIKVHNSANTLSSPSDQSRKPSILPIREQLKVWNGKLRLKLRR